MKRFRSLLKFAGTFQVAAQQIRKLAMVTAPYHPEKVNLCNQTMMIQPAAPNDQQHWSWKAQPDVYWWEVWGRAAVQPYIRGERYSNFVSFLLVNSYTSYTVDRGWAPVHCIEFRFHPKRDSRSDRDCHHWIWFTVTGEGIGCGKEAKLPAKMGWDCAGQS